MPWKWRYEDQSGAPVELPGRPAEAHPSQADAESWLGEHWRGLLEAGVDQVTLQEDGRDVYGPMSLHAPD
jgi:hypothetical protein